MRWYPAHKFDPNPGQMCLVTIRWSDTDTYSREEKAKFFEGENRWVIFGGEQLRTFERVESWTPYNLPEQL
jgi:predicted NACHT family NTPase